ncbi:hypothetical protein RUM44_009572 [Polyplax serrata]|uniref:EGF-like domain-containing protein n=1 Tax=Polyplax serrata TaxID=468196 RepID=A0ABR1AT26_POLSC
MLTFCWILLLGILHVGYAQNIRHGRTRYFSGKNQIYASGYTENNNENETPFIDFWERPLQMLETSMNVRKKLSSRPLFSWDIPDEATAFSFEDNTSTTSNAPIERSTSSSDGFLQYDGTRHSSLPLRVVKSREGHRDGKKEFTIKRSSFLYLSSPTTKHKRFKINRKKSINEINKSEQRIRPGWRTEQTSSPHGNLLRKKKRGRNNGRKKPEKNTDNEVHVFRPQHAMNLKKAEAIRSHPGGRKEAPTNATLEDLCSKMEDRCDHRCHVVNGKAVCLCFKGFKPVGLTKCSDNETDIGRGFWAEPIQKLIACRLVNTQREKERERERERENDLGKPFEENGPDVNECEVNNGGCNGKCVNTIGSRKCICGPGFRLVEGTCVDVNECLLRNGHGPCQNKCINTVGSYSCSCEGLPGTKLSSDKHTCEYPDECDPEAEGCSDSCIRVSGRTFCMCPDGFELGFDWKTCHDIDECSNLEDYDVECSQTECINTVGSYKCSMNNNTNLLA